MKKYIIILSASALLASCSSYHKALKSEDKALKYETATKLYEEDKHNKAIKLFEQIEGSYRGKPSGEGLFYRLSKSYYATKQYYLAAEKFKSFANGYPKSEKREEAMFLRAKSLYNVSPVYSKDQEDTESAIEILQLFIDTYPNSAYLKEANELYAELNDKLELKAFEIAKQYNKIGEFTRNYNAAITALDNFMLDFPGSKYREDAMFYKYDSAYKLAINSVDSKKKERLEKAIAIYGTLNSTFVDSKYKKEAADMFATLNKELVQYSN